METIKDLRLRVAGLEAELEEAQNNKVLWMKYYSQSTLVVVNISKIIPTALSTGAVTPWEALTAIDAEMTKPAGKLDVTLHAFRAAVIDKLIKNLRSATSDVTRVTRATAIDWLVAQKGRP